MAERESRQLEGQTAVIIGAQGQVADSISEAFAREGAFIYLTALDTLCLHETEARTKGTAGFDAVGVETLELDPSDEQQVWCRDRRTGMRKNNGRWSCREWLVHVYCFRMMNGWLS